MEMIHPSQLTSGVTVRVTYYMEVTVFWKLKVLDENQAASFHFQNYKWSYWRAGSSDQCSFPKSGSKMHYAREHIA